MSPPFMANRAGRPRGPPPFIVQLLRAPLTLNNIIAFLVTKSVVHHRHILSFDTLANATPPPPPPFDFDGPRHGKHHGGPPHHPHGHHHGPCGKLRPEHILGLLSLLFIFSSLHNVITVMRMHRIRRSVFGESVCAARRRWRRGEVTEEERQSVGDKFKEMGKKMPSLPISIADVVLAVAFFGVWMLTLLLGAKEGKVELGFGYASVGALVACILNLLIGVNGLKLWARNRRQQKEAAASVEEATELADEKVQLLEN